VKSFFAYKDKRHKTVSENGRGDAKEVEALRLHPLEIREISEQALQPKQSGKKPSSFCS
jgi:hypothetical protein